MTDEINNCAIEEEEQCGLDHKVITIEVYSESLDIVVEVISQRYNWNKADW